MHYRLLPPFSRQTAPSVVLGGQHTACPFFHGLPRSCLSLALSPGCELSVHTAHTRTHTPDKSLHVNERRKTWHVSASERQSENTSHCHPRPAKPVGWLDPPPRPLARLMTRARPPENNGRLAGNVPDILCMVKGLLLSSPPSQELLIASGPDPLRGLGASAVESGSWTSGRFLDSRQPVLNSTTLTAWCFSHLFVPGIPPRSGH